MERLRPTVKVITRNPRYPKIHADRPFLARAEIIGHQREGYFETWDEAVEWLDRVIFDVPSWEDVTGNGRWSCE